MLAIQLLIAAVVIPQGVAMVTYRELLPFSPFPMFSYPQRAFRATVFNAYGVEADGGGERSLMTTEALGATFPLDGRVLQWDFEQLALEEAGAARTEAALQDLFERYERGRTRGRHTLPPLARVRLYRESWSLRFDRANADAPDRRERLASYPPEPLPGR